MKFVQIIEFKTKDIDGFNKALDDWIERTAGVRTNTRALQTRDRDAADTYLQIVEFPSYEEAMENSNRPETNEFSQKMMALCDGDAIFRNLDVVSEADG